jgi:hypothetical protein
MVRIQSQERKSQDTYALENGNTIEAPAFWQFVFIEVQSLLVNS